MFDPDDYFFQEEFIFPEQGGVTGTRRVSCPHCRVENDLVVDVGNIRDEVWCEHCGQPFAVNWNTGQTSFVDDE
jgi:hypothetical protein